MTSHAHHTVPSGRAPVTAEDVETAVMLVAETLQPAAHRDWSIAAGPLEWNCRRTADHLGSCLFAYAGQVALRPRDRYLSFEARADEDAAPEQMLEFVEASGRLLATMVRTAPPEAPTGFHPYGSADAEGFAGMGCVETLVHGDDIATGLGLVWEPPRALCARVVARMFPDLASIDADPWTLLRHATGRAPLDGRPAATSWRWHGAPLPYH